MAFFSRRTSRWLLGLVALVAAVLVLAPMAIGQGFPFSYPIAPPGTPIGNVPSVANTRGDVTWGPISLDAGSLSPGSAAQIFQTNATPAANWVTQTGDTTINSSGVTTTGKINGASVPIAGSLTTGNVLQVSGASALTYGLVSSTAGISPGISGQVLWTPNGSASTLWSYEAFRNAATADLADPTGSSDSSSAIHACLTTAAASHRCCWLPPGTFKVANPITVPNGACLVGSGPDQSILNGTMAASGAQSQAILYATNTSGSSTTLASTPTIGGNTVSVNSLLSGAIAAGAQISIASVALRAQIFTVVSTSGGGPFTVTLDRAIRDKTYANGGTVTVITSRPSNILIDGVGFKGTATRFIEIVACYQTEGRNLWMDASSMATPADIVASFDIAGFGCAWRGVRVNMGGNSMTSGAIALESVENGLIADSFVQNASTTSQSAVEVFDGLDDTIDNTETDNSYVGFQITADGNTSGSDGTRLNSVRAFKSVFAGIYDGAGSTNTVITSPTIRDVTDYGLLTDGNIVGVKVTGGQIANASGGNALVYLTSGVSGVRLDGVELVGNSSSSHAVQAAGAATVQAHSLNVSGTLGTVLDAPSGAEFDVDGLDITATLGTGILNGTGGYARMKGVHFVAAGGGLNLLALTAGRLDLSQSKFIVSGTANLVVVANSGAVARVSDTYATSGGGNALVTEPGTIVDGLGNDFTGYSSRAFQSGGTMLSSLTTGSQWEYLVNTNAVAGLTSASSTTGVLCLGGYASASCSSSNPTLQGDNGGNSFLYAPNASGELYLGAGAADWGITSTALFPQSAGGATLGTAALPVGAAYFGAGNGGYTTFQAVAGTHNTQDGISTHQVMDLRLSSYSATNANSYTLASAHHGFTYSCHVSGRVVTQGLGGGCAFWGSGQGVPDILYRTNFSWSAYCTASNTCNHTGAGWYDSVDTTTSGETLSGSTLAHPAVIAIGGITVSGLTITLQWQYVTDSGGPCTGTIPVLDLESACDFWDN